MASYTAPILHATGDDLAVTDYNAVANNTTFLYQAPYIMAYNSVVTSLGNSAFTQVALGGLTASGYGFSVSSNNIVVPLTGIYSAYGSVEVTPSGTSVLVTAIYHNGSNVLQSRNQTADPMGQPISGLISCSAGDTLALYAFQDQGSSLNTDPGAGVTFLHVNFVGSQ